MPQMTPTWFLIGSLGAVGYLTGLVQGNELLMQFARLLPHLALFRWWWTQSPPQQDPVRFGLGLGLLGCATGDFVLRKPQGFIAGVFGFLIAQIGFTAAFLTLRPKAPAKEQILCGLPLLLYAGGLVTYLWPSLGELRIPVAAYATALALMTWKAWLTRIPAARVGALLFLTSDSLLAIDKFVPAFHEQPMLRFPIILTYWGALAALVHTSIRSQLASNDSAGLRLVR